MQVHTHTSWLAQQLCAECLGLLGAVDPARVELALEAPEALSETLLDLLKTLIIKHLVRLLRVAQHIHVLDAASLAIQVSCLLYIASTAEMQSCLISLYWLPSIPGSAIHCLHADVQP